MRFPAFKKGGYQMNNKTEQVVVSIFLYAVSAAICFYPYDGLARTMYVAMPGYSGNVPPYTNWSDAATNVQLAVDLATNGDTIVVSNGTYYLTNEIRIIKTNLVICGKTGNPADVILDGHNYPGKPVTNRCVYVNGNVIIDGFSITNGRALGQTSTFNGYGGGIHLYDGISTVRNCIVAGNIAFSNEATQAGGGGIGISYGTNYIEQCDIHNNGVEGRGGGVIFYRYTESTMSRCTISNNWADTNNPYSSGGGVALTSANAIYSCIVSSNLALQGGGVFFDAGGYLRGCLLRDNYSYTRGGGASQWIMTMGAMENCTIVNNTCGGNGGGLFMRDGFCVNSIICSNSAVSGNDIYNYFAANTNRYWYCNVPATLPINQGNDVRDPLFTGWLAGDVTLRKGSPCINTATNLDWMPNVADLEGHRWLGWFSKQAERGVYVFIPEGALFSVR